MDPNQFKQFLEVMQTNQRTLIKELVNQLKPTAEGETQVIKVSHVPPFESFDPSKEKFNYYKQRFENYLSMKEIQDDKKAQMLLNSIGASNYNILAALVAPKKPSSLGYDELVNELEKHLAPKKNALVSQHYFLSKYQKEGENIADFVASLRRDVAECDFNVKCQCDSQVSAADLLLRAQFIRGIKDNSIKEQLLQSNLLSFNEIVSKAMALEASKSDCRELSKTQPFASSTSHAQEEINKVSFRNHQSRNRSKSNSQSSRSKSFSHNRSNSFNRSNSKSFNSSNSRYNGSRKSKIDYEKLGINNMCLRCGKDNHRVSDCYNDASKFKCKACHKVGHVERVCVKTLLSKRQSRVSHLSDDESVDECYPTYSINKIIDIYPSNNQGSVKSVSNQISRKDAEKYFINVSIDNVSQCFEVDSGSAHSLLPMQQFKKLNIKKPLNPTKVVFRSYTGEVFVPYGTIQVEVKYKETSSIEELFIVPNGLDALFGRIWVRHLNVNLNELDQEPIFKPSNTTPEIFTVYTLNDIERRYHDLFVPKVGCVPKFEVKLQLREGVKPSYTREREVPYALREKVERELDTLEAAEIITKCETSDWGSPLVAIPKTDGSVRLCVDYKVGVNECLVNSNYPIKKIEDVLNSLCNSKYFCTLDLFKAYLHLKVDEQSSVIQTISTHRGTYRMNRLSFGIKPAPSEFNRIFEQILRGLPKCESYFDDIIIHGRTLGECKQNLNLCLERLRAFDLHLNLPKCKFFQTRIEHLGYQIQLNKISKSPSKVKAITEMPRPTDLQGLRRFLGLVTYYSRFLPNFSSVTHPLRQLLRKNQKFRWSAACQAAFIKLKQEIASDRVVRPFDPTLPVLVATDASPTGIAAVLSHEVNGVEQPVAFVSRSLTEAEQNYSQIDREALAIVFACDRLYHYLYGRHFSLITDNKALTRIFHRKTALPKMTSARLLRYASFLSGFNYSVVFRKGIDNNNVDCLSRAPIKECDSFSADAALNREVHQICVSTLNEISTISLTSTSIAAETGKDPDLAKLCKEVLRSETESEYLIDHGILFRAHRVVIPKSLQPAVLQELHSTHVGITKMKQLARRYCYWKNIDKDIEHLVKSCPECASVKHQPNKAPLHHWDPPENNWDRIHIDYAGPLDNRHFLIILDAKSRWAEIKILQNEAPTSSNTIKLLDQVFSFHGYPSVMVSDNAKIFSSDYFTEYCKSNGIVQKFTAPNHPATNGLAERNVQTLKRRLKTMSNEKLSIHEKVQKILFRYRATPLVDGKTPAENYLNRKIKIKLDAMRPHQEAKSPQKLKPKTRVLQVGDSIQARFLVNNRFIWKFGQIIRKLGLLHYIVKLDEGREVKRHINQLLKTSVNRKQVTFDKSTHQKPIDTVEESKPASNQSFLFDPLCSRVLRPIIKKPSTSYKPPAFQKPCIIQQQPSTSGQPHVRKKPPLVDLRSPMKKNLSMSAASSSSSSTRPQREKKTPRYLGEYDLTDL